MSKIVLTATLAAVVGTMLAPAATASCVPAEDLGRAPKARRAPQRLSGFVPASLVLVSDDSPASIVGLWDVTFLAKGNPPGGVPDGPIDSAYVQWHSDGTELMNSSRPPLTGSFCMGVWKKTGPFTYSLVHVAKSWTNDGATFVGPAVIREEVVLAHGGQSYSGTFTITQYDTDGNVLPPTPIVGVIRGTRITAN
jgi:hypothetical protein